VGNRAGILIRVSTARQGQEGASTDVQRRDCGDYCERMGWQVAMVEEDHQSGTSFDRPGFRKVAEAARRGEIDRLVIWDIDRFGRNLIDSLLALRDFEDAGVEIHDRNGPVKNDLLRDIRLAVAADFSRQLSEKVTRNMRHRAQGGHWVALAPFGYDLIPCPDCGRGKKLSPNAQAEIVTEIFRRFDVGHSFANMRDWLRQEHGLTVGLEWVKSRLRNSAYTGTVIYDRRQRGKFKRAVEEIITVLDAHPALIDRETFERIQARFKAPRAIASPIAKPLDGLVFCGVCGAMAYRVTGGKKGSYRFYYACSTQRRFKTCVPNQLPYRRVLAAVEEQLPRFPVDQERATITDRLLSLVEPDLERLLKGSSDVRQKLEAEIKKLEGQQGMVYEDRLHGRVPTELASRKMVEIQERLDGARKELKTLKATSKDDWRKWVDYFGTAANAVAPVERELLRLLVSRIVIQDGTVTVEWTDYAHSLVNQVDGSPSRRPAAGTLRLRST